MIDGPACAEKTNFAACLDGAICRMHRKFIYNVHQRQKEQSDSIDDQAITEGQSWQYIVCAAFSRPGKTGLSKHVSIMSRISSYLVII